MQKELRDQFNKNFTEEKYNTYIKRLNALHPGTIDFRIAETPIYIPKDFTQKMLDTCEDIIDLIISPDFKKLTAAAIPKDANVPNENEYSDFIAFDFGICQATDGSYEPQLIEMQGFPSLFAFQLFHSELTAEYAGMPATHSPYLNDYTKETYNDLFKKIILAEHHPENVILMDIFPEQQKTRVDFYCTEDLLGIKTVCVTKLLAEGNKLFYNNEGKKTEVKRIYNRLIFDDLHQQKNIEGIVDFTKPYDVEWVTHPNWFYRISKYTLPFIRNRYVPETFFLNELKEIPADLENYVLKPLFSFAGMGVVIDVTKQSIDEVKDPGNWILQRKVQYADAIKTPADPAKAEIRLFYFWEKGKDRPVAVHNLARMSKGKMIGTRYNKDKSWVGASVAFFEK